MKLSPGPIRRFWKDCAAAEIAEAAFTLPLMFVFLLGIFQFARVYMVYSTMQRAAQEGAHAAAGWTCATCTSIQLTADLVASNAVHPVFHVSHVDDTLLVTPAPPDLLSCVDGKTPVPCDGTTSTPKVCLRRNVVLNVASGGGTASGTRVCGTALTLTYPYGFSLPSVSKSPPYISRQTYAINMNAQAQVVGED